MSAGDGPTERPADPRLELAWRRHRQWSRAADIWVRLFGPSPRRSRNRARDRLANDLRAHLPNPAAVTQPKLPRDPRPILKDADFASVIESDVPIVVQHTRLDSRQAENALLSTIAFADTA